MSASRRREEEAVVLLHGLWFGRWTLALLARRLRGCGFRTHLFGYPTVSRGLGENARALDAFARSLSEPVVHFVGHSLGGLVIRALFRAHPQRPPGRIVTLGAPHGGSHPARVLSRTRVGRRIVGLSVAELLAAAPERWAVPDRELGVLAGYRSLGLGRLVRGLPRPNDGVVPLEEARLPGAADAIDLEVAHTEMLLSRAVAHQVVHFLEHGRFDHARALSGAGGGPAAV